MVKRILILGVVCFCGLLMAGCDAVFSEHGLIHDRGADYVKAKNDEALTIPQDLSQRKLEEFFVIPESTTPPPEKPDAVSLIPPGSVLVHSGEVPKRP